MKNLHSSKDIVKRVRDELEVSAISMIHIGLVGRIHKEFLKSVKER